MKAQALMEALFSLSEQRVPDTVDTLKAGSPDKEVRKVATCFIATAQVIRQAAAWGADLIITHEPTFYEHRDDVTGLQDDPVIGAKKTLLQQSGMTVYRYHDHAHCKKPDVIVDGLFKKLGWEISWSSFDQPAVLKTPMTARQMAADIQRKLGIAHVRVAGSLDAPLRSLSPMIGSPGEKWQLSALMRPDVDALLAGEVSEWRVCEYARDASLLGQNKAVLALGHAGSERDGMELLCAILQGLDPALETRYFDCGEVYAYPEA